MRDRARNSVRGRKAKAAGTGLETWLDVQHEVARRLGILARIDKVDPPAVVRNGRVEFGERTGADYIGMLGCGPTGRIDDELLAAAPFLRPGYCAIEAKSTSDVRFYKSEVKPKQQEHLDQVARGGGLALLVVEFRDFPSILANPPLKRSAIFAIPWAEAPWAVARSAESLSFESMMSGGGREWLIAPCEGSCYLERFHPRGVPSSPVVMRSYARE